MSFVFEYHWKGSPDSFVIERPGVYYLELGEDKLRVYKHPLGIASPVLLVGEREHFLVYEGEGFALIPNRAFERTDITLKLLPQTDPWEIYKPYFLKMGTIIKTQMKKPLVFSSVSILILIGLIAGMVGSEDDTSIDVEERQIEENISGSKLGAIRLKLAQKAMEEKQYAMAVDLSEKVLRLYPADKEAMGLKEKALLLMESDKKLVRSEIKKETHDKEILGRAAELMAVKDLQGAMFQVKQILDENPQHPEAYQMMQSIQGQLAEMQQKEVALKVSEQELVEQALSFWNKGKAAYASKNLAETFEILSKGIGLLEERNLNPPFRLDMKELLTEVSTQLEAAARPLVEQARKYRDAGGKSGGANQVNQYQQALALYLEAQKKYPQFPLLKEEMELITHKLDQAAEPFFMEAQTLRDLEGCCKSLPQLKKIMGMVRFDQVPIYQRAKEMVDSCFCQQ